MSKTQKEKTRIATGSQPDSVVELSRQLAAISGRNKSFRKLDRDAGLVESVGAHVQSTVNTPLSDNPGSSSRVKELSHQLAAISGLRLRSPREGEAGYTKAGDLRSLIPGEFFHWRKCPIHGTWLQPELKPFQHWRCAARVHVEPTHSKAMNARTRQCVFSRPAKLRTRIERRIFAVAAFLEEHA